MRIDRLKILAAHLEKLEKTPRPKRPRIFDMHLWWFPGDPGSRQRCKACALGEATTIPKLAKGGLLIKNNNGLAPRVPEYRNSSGYLAAALFFKLPYPQARSLFSPGPKTPGEVAKKIRRLIAESKEQSCTSSA